MFMYQCYQCGKKIGFLNPKPQHKNDKPQVVKTDGVKRFFVPNPEGRIFYDKFGNKRVGLVAPDGIEGYLPHECS